MAAANQWPPSTASTASSMKLAASAKKDCGAFDIDPKVDSLRSDARFADLAKRVGLPQ